ncbi:unnamed protein product, partial [Ceratitis capitata]
MALKTRLFIQKVLSGIPHCVTFLQYFGNPLHDGNKGSDGFNIQATISIEKKLLA